MDWPQCTTNLNVLIPIHDDDIAESDEKLGVIVYDAHDVILDGTQPWNNLLTATVTIRDND